MSSIVERHKTLERNVTLLAIFAFAAVTIGGIVEIAPLFWIDNTIEKVEGMRPYTPLEQAGRDIYVREGCYVCHSQMIRPFRDETELWPLQPRGGIDVRPPVPVGLEAHRAGSGPRGRQVFG
jgi:cytochrome c oxidase cbb3-type subunit 2